MLPADASLFSAIYIQNARPNTQKESEIRFNIGPGHFYGFCRKLTNEKFRGTFVTSECKQ